MTESSDRQQQRVLPRALRAALPLYAGLVVTYGAAFAFKALLIARVFSGPESMARLETLDRALQWIVSIVLLGVPAALQRRVAADPERRWSWIGSAFLLFGVAIGVVLIAVQFVPGISRWMVGQENAPYLFDYVQRAAGLGCLAICGAVLLAGGRIGMKAALEAGERVLALAVPLALIFITSQHGLTSDRLADADTQESSLSAIVQMTTGTSIIAGAGAFIALAVVFRRRPTEKAAPARRPLQLLRGGAPQLALSVLENVRPLLLLRLAYETTTDVETGLLATAMAFALPLIVLPELAAQALFPKMLGPEGEGSHVEGERRGMFREVLIVGIPLILVYGALAALLLPLAREGRYAGAVLPLLVLLPGVLAHGLTAHTGYVLLVRDKLAHAAGASAAALVATLALAWALMPAYGAAGGAVALSAGLLLRTALYQLAARKT